MYLALASVSEAAEKSRTENNQDDKYYQYPA